MQDLILIIAGFFLWILGANWLLKGAEALSLKFNISQIVVGMTLVSLITSFPEILLSITAVTEGVSDLALKTVLGSNMVNLGLILGMVLIFSGMELATLYYKRKWLVVMLATTLFSGFIYFDGEIQRLEGFFMLVALFLILVYLFWFQRKEEVFVVSEGDRNLPLYSILLFFGLGGLALCGGSELILGRVWKFAASDREGVSKIMSLVFSVGVAIPEMVVALIAIIKKQNAISLGNLLGANMFNVLGALGISARIAPIKVVDSTLLFNDVLWMMGISFLLLPLLFLSKESRMDWKSGSLLLVIYVAFTYSTLS